MEEKAKTTVERYMRAWCSGNTRRMYKNSQITWKDRHKETVLKNLCEGLHLQKFEIMGTQLTGEASVKVAVEMTINDEVVASCVMVIAENGAYKPTVEGVLGVNPISVLKYKVVCQKD